MLTGGAACPVCGQAESICRGRGPSHWMVPIGEAMGATMDLVKVEWRKGQMVKMSRQDATAYVASHPGSKIWMETADLPMPEPEVLPEAAPPVIEDKIIPGPKRQGPRRKAEEI